MTSLSITERLAIHRRVGHGDPVIYNDAIAEIERLERALAAKEKKLKALWDAIAESSVYGGTGDIVDVDVYSLNELLEPLYEEEEEER